MSEQIMSDVYGVTSKGARSKHKLTADGEFLACDVKREGKLTIFAPSMKQTGLPLCKNCEKIIVLPEDVDAEIDAQEGEVQGVQDVPDAPVADDAPIVQAEVTAPAEPSREELLALIAELQAQNEARKVQAVPVQDDAQRPILTRPRGTKHVKVNPYRGGEYMPGTIADYLSRAEEILGSDYTFQNGAMSRYVRAREVLRAATGDAGHGFADDMLMSDLTADKCGELVRMQVRAGINGTSAGHNLMILRRLADKLGVSARLRGITKAITSAALEEAALIAAGK